MTQGGKTGPEGLLARAYALSGEAETLALYEDWASTYDRTMMEGLEYLTPQLTSAMLGEAMRDLSAPVLDVGSGTGLAGECLARMGFATVDALDFSPAMLEVAAARQFEGRKVYRAVIEADLNKPLTIVSEAYAALICTGTFTHAHVGAGCLEELFRILQPGGLFACTVHLDVWEPAGFRKKTEELSQRQLLKKRAMTHGKYFATDDKPQGWYILWEKPD